MNTVLKATHEGDLNIGEVKIRAYNLSDGTRVLSRLGFLQALGRTGKAKGGRKYDQESKMPVFLTAKNLNPFITNELIEDSKPINFKDLNGNTAIGYKAQLLPHVCYVFVDAYDAGVIKDSQAHIAERAKILIRGFATTGIVALVDEATGYQQIREKDALQKFLEKFLLEEKGKWIKTYPDEFFESIFKMKGLTWTTANKGKKPQWIGHHINDFVYSRIAPKVLVELRKINPKNEKGNRKGKHPQYISTDFGHPKLKEHLASLIALAKGSGYNFNNFKRFVERAFPKYEQDGSQSIEIPFTEED